ncbi:MAG: Gfo/Idh/MocA family oxidoreductase [Planctomycetota bacterium]
MDARQFALSRRGFIASSSAMAAASIAAGAGFAKPATDIRVAVIGFRARGRNHIDGLKRNVVALCDVDERILKPSAEKLGGETGRKIDVYTDYRRLLERDDLDGVAIATPNHTHSLIAVAAAQAGKHVYVEKPVSHNIWEGRQMVAAAKKHGVVMQCGTQSRSSPSLQAAVEFVQGGGLGKIQYAIGTCYKPRRPIGNLSEPLTIPEGVDYDLWCGPAEKRDLFRPQLHYDWHWDSNTGNGDMGNQGIHQVDIARWFLGEDSLPPSVLSVGGRLGYDDAGDTPNTQTVLFGYERAPLIFETRGLPRSAAFHESKDAWERNMDRFRGSGIGVLVQCERGHVLIPSYVEAIAFDADGNQVQRWKGGGDHFANWLTAVEAGDDSLLNGPIREGHLSSSICHLGGISHTLGEQARMGEIAERCVGEALFSGSLERMAGHLRANGVDVDGEAALTSGAQLRLDPENETFVGNDEASRLRTREYRAPFAVPDVESQV